MNLFQDYHNKFLEFLIILKKNKTIEVSEDLKGLILEAAPKEILGDFPRLSREKALELVYKTEARWG